MNFKWQLWKFTVVITRTLKYRFTLRTNVKVIFFKVKALLLPHTAHMLSLLQALYANCRRVIISCGLLVNVVLVDSLLAHLAV